MENAPTKEATARDKQTSAHPDDKDWSGRGQQGREPDGEEGTTDD